MRLARYLTTFLYAVCLSFPVHSDAQSVTKLDTNHGFLVVQVFINGSGPYSFIFDTGSNRTLVRNELLETLGISSKRLVPLNMTNGVSYVHEAVAKSVAVAGLGVNDLEIEGIDDDQLSRMSTSIQGVLGEDFLKHFEVLIDNRANTLTLDKASDLADSLSGEHLPLSFSGKRSNEPTPDRLVLDVKLPLIGTLHFLLDSGTDSSTFFPSKAVPKIGNDTFGTTLNTPIRNGLCRIDFVSLRIGKNSIPALRIASYLGVQRDNVDVDGTLPTAIFDRLFISHAGAYAIANPHRRKPSRDSTSLLRSGN